jgi:hypothetical protein
MDGSHEHHDPDDDVHDDDGHDDEANEQSYRESLVAHYRDK